MSWKELLKNDEVPIYDPFTQEVYDVGEPVCENCGIGNLDEQVECSRCGDKWCPECYDLLSDQWESKGLQDICPKCVKEAKR